MNHNENNIKVKIKASEVLAKCKRKEDWVNFARELGKFSFFLIIDLYYPNQPGFDGKFFIKFLKGEKAVSIKYSKF